ncbi:pyruvate dehydrogenase E2 component (dihydrolipoamide acetyltransferase) [Nitrosomonas sp. Nm51]|uniref:dihydrolipoyllysine-residue acetyltransferase n=1 Tax=Nitrosomonas sp. Nm51 TaxID=133720 RepID=UPI0008D25FE3|nr:dihydrolipoyllysine-residue acetyltransferase [Nitrosomonas sp. Nm51]SER22383.1 pyruvate dehydrogenase E2 component (dihydrolipoamide acetyltransferase) [Nitrosomonas sp. Nm51]
MSELKTVCIPDIGDFSDVPVIDIFVQAGTKVNAEDSLLALESDKATIDIPAPYSGTVKELKVKTGDKVSEGTPVVVMEITETAEISDKLPESDENEARLAETADKESVAQSEAEHQEMKETKSVAPMTQEERAMEQPMASSSASDLVEPIPSKAHAGPSVRRFARELGVNLDRITGSGRKQRIIKEDVQAYVKAKLSQIQMDTKGAAAGTPFDLLPWPQIDFAKYGPVEVDSLSRIKQIAGANLHRNWVMIPHVTQFDEADITDLEALRKESNSTEKEDTVKLTLLSFLMKALIASLKKFPEFNASLDRGVNGESSLIIKRYYHIGFAVDTINGLVVPVIQDVDQKGVVAIARELGELAALARDGKLKPAQMQGASFTISSLGGIGGTAFTPIINAPEVAILGVSKASYKPVFRGGQFEPRLVLPLSLSYDHRVIDGAAAARFTSHLAEVLTDMRLALL